jgi:SagB-type dehydrogenase family enzyme
VLAHTDLRSPHLRATELPYQEFTYDTAERVLLARPAEEIATPCLEVLQHRRSRRSFAPLRSPHLGDLLWYVAKVRDMPPPTQPLRWQHRSTPSAGGRHPIDLLITQTGSVAAPVYLYEPLSHALVSLRLGDQEQLTSLHQETVELIPHAQATAIWFAAQFDRTLARYENGESLIWRDAGALIATINLVAETLGLNCCALGITGEPWLSGVLHSHPWVVGVGGCLVGERALTR